MILNHVAIECSSDKRVEAFYKEILGMKKIKDFIVQRSTSQRVFHIDKEFRAMVYSRDNVTMEIFINENRVIADEQIPHLCLEVEDREELIVKCEKNHLEVIKIPKENGYLLFIRDFDGNLFEIKKLP